MKFLKSDKKIEYENLFFCFAIVLSSIVNLFVKTVRLVIPNTYSIDTLLVYAVFAYVFVRAFPTFKKRIKFVEFFIICFFTVAFSLSFMSEFSTSSITVDVIKTIITDGVLLYLAARTVSYTKNLVKYMRISAILTIMRVIFDVYIFNSKYETGYSQYDGYLLLTAMALIFIPMVTERKPTDFLIAAVNLVATLLTGARGPFVLCVVLMIIAAFYVIKNKKLSIIILAIVAIIAYAVILNLESILEYLMETFGDSASIRVIERLLDDTLLEDDARFRLYNLAVSYVKEHTLLGCGVVNDRVILNSMMPALGEAVGSYPHNIFLELMMQFGLIGGMIISISLIISIIKKYLNLRSFEYRIMLIGLVMIGLAPLMVSGSYLSWPMFYALLGFIVNDRNLTEKGRSDV